MEFRILGPLEVIDRGQQLPLGGGKQRGGGNGHGRARYKPTAGEGEERPARFPPRISTL